MSSHCVVGQICLFGQIYCDIVQADVGIGIHTLFSNMQGIPG